MQSCIDIWREQGLLVNLAPIADAIAGHNARVALPPKAPPVRRHLALKLSFSQNDLEPNADIIKGEFQKMPYSRHC